MATSFGSITIVDNTDFGQLVFQLSGSTVRQQQKNINTKPNPTYYPDWTLSPLIVSPLIFYDGEAVNLTDTRIYSLNWYHTAYDRNNPSTNRIVSTISTDDEYIANNTLRRKINLTNSGRKYIAVLKFKPFADLNDTLEAIAEIDFTLAEYGANGEAAKSLQLSGDGSHFIYKYTGDLINSNTITLTARKQNIIGINWYCDNNLIYTDTNGNPTLDSTLTGVKYEASTLTVAGKAVSGYTKITDLTNNFTSDKEAQFKIVETNGTSIVLNGFEDYFSIYKIDEASPGTATYTAFLDNDNDTVYMYNNVSDFSNAISTLYIQKSGVNDISNWQINITKSEGLNWDNNYPTTSADNSGPYNNKIKIGSMTTNTGQVTFTATKSYELTEDIVIDLNKTYYNRVISNHQYVYNEVSTPASNPHEAGYYESIPQVTLIKNYNIAKSSSLVSHSLRLSAVNANRTSANVYTPSEITLGAIERTGGAGTTDYTATNAITYIIYPVNGDPVTKQGTPPINLTLATLTDNNDNNIGPINYIEVILGGSSSDNYITAEDRQSITITPVPTEPWQVDLLQTFDSISTNYNYVVNNTATYEIPFKVFKGINLQTVNYPNANHNNYPYVVATSSSNTIIPLYYNENSQVSTENASINKIKYSVTANNTNIGAEGTITLTFYLNSTTSITKTYKYQAKTEALDAITLQILQIPGKTFHNQDGFLYAQPILTEGASDITDTATNITFTWYYYDLGDPTKDFIKIKNWSNSEGNGKYYNDKFLAGILDTSANPWEFYKTRESGTIRIQNGSKNSKFLQVQGAGIESFGYFKLEVNCSINGLSRTFIEYLTFDDINDPLQVNVVSTLGKELINGQGLGAIYVRVTQGDTDIDPIEPDNYLGVGLGDSTPPTDNNYLGFVVFDNTIHTNDNNRRYYTYNYYTRDTNNSNWEPRGSQTAQYTWTFRDVDNRPITAESISTNGIHENIHDSIKYLILNEQYQPQFIYLDREVVNKRITAYVKVEV